MAPNGLHGVSAFAAIAHPTDQDVVRSACRISRREQRIAQNKLTYLEIKNVGADLDHFADAGWSGHRAAAQIIRRRVLLVRASRQCDSNSGCTALGAGKLVQRNGPSRVVNGHHNFPQSGDAWVVSGPAGTAPVLRNMQPIIWLAPDPHRKWVSVANGLAVGSRTPATLSSSDMATRVRTWVCL